MAYMSGRALHPISINLAAKLQKEFGGTLDISFSAGADCFNIADILKCGLKRAKRVFFERRFPHALRNARRPTQLEDPRHFCAIGET